MQQYINTILENNKTQMTTTVVSMQENWKREQDLVLKLEGDLSFKED